MSLNPNNVVIEVSNTVGTGTLTLQGPQNANSVAFFNAFANNTTLGYFIQDIGGNSGQPTGILEVGIGQFITNSTANSLIRSFVLNNSYGVGNTSFVNFPGNSLVFYNQSAYSSYYANSTSGGGSNGIPGGTNTNIQFYGAGGVFAGSNGLTFTTTSNTLSIGNTTVNTTINSTSFSGTANDTLFVGTVSAANVVSNAQLTANLANYLLLSGVSANILVNTANDTLFVGTVSAANVVSNAQLQANLALYQTLAGEAANVLTLTSNNALQVVSGQTDINSTMWSIGNTTVNTQINSTAITSSTITLEGNVDITGTLSIGGSGGAGSFPAAGSNTDVQTNDSGSLYGDGNFTYNKVTQTLTVANVVQANLFNAVGTDAGFAAYDRSGTANYSAFYRSGSNTRFWDNMAGDVFWYTNTGITYFETNAGNTAVPTVFIYKQEALTGNNDTEGAENAALQVLVESFNVSAANGAAPITQTNGILSHVIQNGTGGAVAFFGAVVGGNDINGAFGTYMNVTTTHNPGIGIGYAADLLNNSNTAMPWASYAPGSTSGILGLDVNAGGNTCTAGVQLRSSSTQGWDVGFGTYGNCIKTAFLMDNSNSATILYANGSHTNGIDLSGATFSGDAIKLPAWTAFTPVVTPSSGSITSYTASGRYQKIGKTVAFTITINITTNGTAAGFLVATLPVTANSTAVCAGRENALTGSMLQGFISSSAMSIFTYSNGYPGGSGAQVIVSGTYESV